MSDDYGDEPNDPLSYLLMLFINGVVVLAVLKVVMSMAGCW